MNNDLAAALNQIIAQATPATAQQTTEEAFAALLSGTTPAPAPAPRHPVRCPRTGGVYAYVHTASEADALTARLAA